jgi:oligopeptide/dipeptide ABC transporter ATP-binding protein
MTALAPQPLLEVTDLSVRFATSGLAVTAVNDVSFKLNRGETLAIVGESGSGKSTTGLAIMGLIDLDEGNHLSGSIRLRRKDGTFCELLAMSDRDLRNVRGNDIGMIFQEPMSSLNPVHTVGTQIVEALRQHQKIDGKAARDRARELLADLGIPNASRCIDSYPHQLSGGMRQRIMIAIALSGNPSILVADEPTTALDATIQAQILELLQVIQQREKMAMIFITHNLGVVAEIAQRAIVMYAGEVAEELPVRELFGGARMPYTKALLRSIPQLTTGTQSQLETIPGVPPNLTNKPPGCAFEPRCGHSVTGRCDVQHPLLDAVAAEHSVRCLRWRDLGANV